MQHAGLRAYTIELGGMSSCISIMGSSLSVIRRRNLQLEFFLDWDLPAKTELTKWPLGIFKDTSRTLIFFGICGL